MSKQGIKYRKWLEKHAPSMVGRRILVTGANSGIGFEAARMFAYLGGEVYLACRNAVRAADAVARIKGEFPTACVEFLTVDLASGQSMDAFVAEISTRGLLFDICLHCAGVYYPRDTHTSDGYAMTEGVNYVGTLYLTDLLMPYMNDNGRMIFTTSLVDRFGHPDRLPRGEGYAAYARSKTMLSAEVIRRSMTSKEKNIRYISVHPGITATNLLSPEKTTHKPFFSRLGHAFLYVFTHSPEKAALTSIWASSNEIENGAVIGPRGLFGISGYPHRTRYARRARKTAEGRIKTLPTPCINPTGEADIHAE